MIYIKYRLASEIKIKIEKELRGIIEYRLVNKMNKKMKKEENKVMKR